MKVLILGGTGLISTVIANRLLARGDAVTLFNRRQRPARLAGEYRLLVGDRTAGPAFEQAMVEAGHFDCVIDMIGYRPAEAASAVRAFAGRTGQYIFCSTVDVYRKPASRYPYSETEAHGPLNAYGRGKAESEALLQAAHRAGRLNVTIIRPAHTYGEGGCFVSTFGRPTSYIDRLRHGRPIIVHGDGSSLWASGHIDDVGGAFAAAAGNALTFGQAYHVTSDEWLTWNDYHRTIAAAIGAPPPSLVHIPTALLARLAPRRAAIVVENFQFNNIFDLTAARRDLGLTTSVALVEGARRTVAWLDAQQRVADWQSDPFDERLLAAWQQLTGAADGLAATIEAETDGR